MSATCSALRTRNINYVSLQLCLETNVQPSIAEVDIIDRTLFLEFDYINRNQVGCHLCTKFAHCQSRGGGVRNNKPNSYSPYTDTLLLTVTTSPPSTLFAKGIYLLKLMAYICSLSAMTPSTRNSVLSGPEMNFQPQPLMEND